MNELLAHYPDEIARIMAQYPPDRKRAAVMPLLHLAQTDAEFISAQSMKDIAELCEMTLTEVGSIIGFYTLYYEMPIGRYHIQVCTDLPCALRGAEQFLADLCAQTGLKVGEPSPDGLFVIEEVKCLAACHRAPVFQVQSGSDIQYHENQTVETALAVIDALREEFNRVKEAQS